MNRRAAFLGFAGVLAFIAIAWLTLSGAAAGFDAAVRDAVHGWTSPLLTSLMVGISATGSDVFMGALGVLSVWQLARLERRRDAIVFVATALAAEVLMEILKLAFHRARPIPFFAERPGSYSFPSGHALKSAVFYLLLASLASRHWTVRAGAALLALLIGISRIYLGVHYPTDVLGGYAIAVVCLAAASYRRTPVCPSE
ncbi:MAG TPA: phosphatase PAP2 family protein [Bryobacteraceae bacterium]|jgi:undecaprenyl-diphosphatase|nr:phosphatase PAP2 family protein [Bryobacteraceae bacterium]